MELDEAIEKEPASGIRAEGGAGGVGGRLSSIAVTLLPSRRFISTRSLHRAASGLRLQHLPRSGAQRPAWGSARP